jgi:hypothetical protein
MATTLYTVAASTDRGQGEICFGKPKRHAHGSIELAGGMEICSRRPSVFTLGMDLSKPEITVGLQRTHPEILRQA